VAAHDRIDRGKSSTTVTKDAVNDTTNNIIVVVVGDLVDNPTITWVTARVSRVDFTNATSAAVASAWINSIFSVWRRPRKRWR
jgi:hypothetical protein